MKNATIKALAERCVAEMMAAGHPAKKRDQATFDFWCGAAVALTIVEHADASAVASTTAMVVATRGFKAVKAMAEEGEQ